MNDLIKCWHCGVEDSEEDPVMEIFEADELVDRICLDCYVKEEGDDDG